MKKKTITGLVNQAAEILQRIVRIKAADEHGYCTCVTCGVVKHWKEMQGGHYIKRQHKKWTLVEENIHPQCQRCNGFLGGNEGPYTLYMIDMYGRDFVDHMHETKTETVKFYRKDLEDLIVELKAQLKEVEAEAA